MRLITSTCEWITAVLVIGLLIFIGWLVEGML